MAGWPGWSGWLAERWVGCSGMVWRLHSGEPLEALWMVYGSLETYWSSEDTPLSEHIHGYKYLNVYIYIYWAYIYIYILSYTSRSVSLSLFLCLFSFISLYIYIYIARGCMYLFNNHWLRIGRGVTSYIQENSQCISTLLFLFTHLSIDARRLLSRSLSLFIYICIYI